MENQVITFDGKEYKLGDFDANQLKYVMQLTDLTAKIEKNRLEYDQYTVAYDVFTKGLREALAEGKGEVKVGEIV